MEYNRRDDSSETLSRRQQRSVGAAIFLINTVALVCFSLLYRANYDALAKAFLEGLTLMFLIAFGMATVSAPFFADSMAGGPQDRATNYSQSVKLHLAVTGITFVALSCLLRTLDPGLDSRADSVRLWATQTLVSAAFVKR